MKRISITCKVFLTLAMIAYAAPLYAGEEGEAKVTGKIFTQLYYDLTDDSTITKKSAVELTRAYLGGKYTLNDQFTINLILDVERLNELTDVTYTLDTATMKLTKKATKNELYEAFLKNAYLEWKGLIPITTLNLGVIGGIAFGPQEKFWGYRYIYKSFMDQNKYAQSADLGLSAKVKVSDFIAVNAAVTQGEGYKKPQDAYGQYQTGLGLEINPLKGLQAYLYGDIMPVKTPGTDSASVVTATAFVGYEMKDKGKVGVEYVMQGNRGGFDSCDVSGISAYVSTVVLKPVEIFARVDVAQSNNDWNILSDGQTIIGGVHYSPVKNVKTALDVQTFMPAITGAKRQNKVFLNTEFSC